MYKLQFGKLCDSILSIHPHILMTGVVEEGLFIVSRFRPLVPQLNHERTSIVLTQAHLLTSIPKTNEDTFGKVRFTMVYHDDLHTFMFPITSDSCSRIRSSDSDNNNDYTVKSKTSSSCFSRNQILVMVVKPPYDISSIAEKVLDYLAAANAISSSRNS